VIALGEVSRDRLRDGVVNLDIESTDHAPVILLRLDRHLVVDPSFVVAGNGPGSGNGIANVGSVFLALIGEGSRGGEGLDGN
jgi:hypothetical protein